MTGIWDDLFGSMDSFRKRMERMTGISDGVKMYGYTIYKGPDGVPRAHGAGAGVYPQSVREPLTDVSADGDTVSIVIELPGVNKDEIRLEGTETSMTVSSDSGKRKFRKTVPLPCSVDPNSAKAEYNNGILEITVDSVDNPKARKIDIA